jgi:drug/metabolite transporter (DMT)-like permease
MALGLLGVLSFSMTLPATRLAVASLNPFIVGMGRAMVAALFAGPLLYFTKQPFLTKPQLRSMALVMLGVIAGFPILSAWAMQRVPASHGAVVLGLLPLTTALAGALRAHERPSPSFWFASALGSFAVIAYALASGGGTFDPADLALLASVFLAALGYAEGARLAREIGGWQVICWALVLGFPLMVVPVALLVRAHGLHATPQAWCGFAYVSMFSAFLGFFAWYRGLALGGVARVGQVQLLQPFFTLAFSAWLLHEHFSLGALGAMSFVAISILLSRRSTVKILPVALKPVVPGAAASPCNSGS